MTEVRPFPTLGVAFRGRTEQLIGVLWVLNFGMLKADSLELSGDKIPLPMHIILRRVKQVGKSERDGRTGLQKKNGLEAKEGTR